MQTSCHGLAYFLGWSCFVEAPVGTSDAHVTYGMCCLCAADTASFPESEDTSNTDYLALLLKHSSKPMQAASFAMARLVCAGQGDGKGAHLVHDLADYACWTRSVFPMHPRHRNPSSRSIQALPSSRRRKALL